MRYTNTLAAINSLCMAGISRQVQHTMLTEEQYQFNLKLARSFAQGMRDLEKPKHGVKVHAVAYGRR